MLGISAGEFLVILLVAAVVLGPKNIAQALHAVQRAVRRFRQWSAKMRAESRVDISTIGISEEDLAAIRSFSAQQYDPRRMVQDAVREEMRAWLDATSGGNAAAGAGGGSESSSASGSIRELGEPDLTGEPNSADKPDTASAPVPAGKPDPSGGPRPTARLDAADKPDPAGRLDAPDAPASPTRAATRRPDHPNKETSHD